MGTSLKLSLCLLFSQIVVAQNSLVGDGFGGRLWYKPTNYAVGSYSGYAICDDGLSGSNQLLGWGSNGYGQLGYSPDVMYGAITPTPVPGMTNVKYYSCGYSMGCIKKDNSAWVWGQYWPSGPTKILDDAYFVDASSDNISFVKTDGTVWSVGSNRTGAFGDGTYIASYNAPKQMLGITNAVRVANNNSSTIVLLSDGIVKTVGGDFFGIARTSGQMLTPEIVPKLKDIVDIKATPWAIMALDKKGDVFLSSSSDTIIKLSQYKDIVAISGCDDGDAFFLLDKDKYCYSFGGCYYNYSLPKTGISDVIDILAGESFGYVIKTDGSLWGIGFGSIWLDLPDERRTQLTQITRDAESGACRAFIFIPNVFTPNGDRVNDVFRVQASGVSSLHCTIYDRWGLMMYEWDGADGYWDGHAQSGPAPSGTYYYIVSYSTAAGTAKTEKGFLTLFR